MSWDSNVRSQLYFGVSCPLNVTIIKFHAYFGLCEIISFDPTLLITGCIFVVGRSVVCHARALQLNGARYPLSYCCSVRHELWPRITSWGLFQGHEVYSVTRKRCEIAKFPHFQRANIVEPFKLHLMAAFDLIFIGVKLQIVGALCSQPTNCLGGLSRITATELCKMLRYMRSRVEFESPGFCMTLKGKWHQILTWSLYVLDF